MKRKQLKFWVGSLKKDCLFWLLSQRAPRCGNSELKQLIEQKGNNVRSWDLIALNDAFRESHGLTRVSRKA